MLHNMWSALVAALSRLVTRESADPVAAMTPVEWADLPTTHPCDSCA